MKILIDGMDFTKVTGGLDKFNLQIGLNTTDNSTSVSVSGTLEFTGKAQEYLQEVFFDDPKNSIGKKVDVNLYMECCDSKDPIAFYMDHSSVELCDCSITGNLIKAEEDAKCRAYLRDKIFWKDNGFLDAVPFYDVHYCEESTFITKILMVVYCIISPMLLILEAIETIINGILKAIDFLVFWKKLKWKIDIPSADNYVELVQGCGRKHPSPLVVDILTYNAERCGLTLDSNLLQVGFYENLLLLQAQNEEGCEDCKYIENNMLNRTTIQIMNDLKPVWNADYRIIDGVLYFDWKKRIKQILQRNILCDVESEYQKGNADKPPCYEFDKTLPAYLRLEYLRDPIDMAGNKRMDTYRLDGEEPGNYSEIVEWNDPPNEYQKGEETVIIPFSPPAFTDDGREKCKDNLFRKENTFGWAEPPHRLVLTMGMSSYPKLILLNKADDSFDPWRQKTGEKAECKALCIQGKLDYDIYEYNTFLWTREDTFEGLYRTYYSMEDPRGGEREMINLQPFTFAFDCEQLKMVMKYGVNLAVKTRYGFGIPERISINFENNTMTVTGVKI